MPHQASSCLVGNVAETYQVLFSAGCIPVTVCPVTVSGMPNVSS